jgi:hypothetical protein
VSKPIEEKPKREGTPAIKKESEPKKIEDTPLP